MEEIDLTPLRQKRGARAASLLDLVRDEPPIADYFADYFADYTLRHGPARASRNRDFSRVLREAKLAERI